MTNLDGIIQDEEKIEDENEIGFALNSGIFSQGVEVTTLSQAKDILEVKKLSDEKFNMLVMEIRAFVIRVFCTVRENAHRFATLINSANEKGEGFVPDDIARMTDELLCQMDDGNKKVGRESGSGLSPKDEKSFMSDFKTEAKILNLDEVKRIFFDIFPGCLVEKAHDFVEILKKSALISLFLTEAEIEIYLMKFSSEENVNQAINQAFKLEEMAIQTMTQKIDKIIGLYLGLCLSLQKTNENGIILNV